MSSGVIAFFVALGVGAWVYNLTMKQSGSQTKTALTVAGIVAFLAFLIIFTVASMLS